MPGAKKNIRSSKVKNLPPWPADAEWMQALGFEIEAAKGFETGYVWRNKKLGLIEQIGKDASPPVSIVFRVIRAHQLDAKKRSQDALREALEDALGVDLSRFEER